MSDRAATVADLVNIVEYMPLVVSIARPYVSDRLDFADLLQQGVVGLLEARQRFDPARGSFGTFARHWVRSAIHRYASQNAHAVWHIPERVWNDALRARATIASTPQAHVAALPVAVRSLAAVVDPAPSLTQPADTRRDNVYDRKMDAEDHFDDNVVASALPDVIKRLLRRLDERQRIILELFYGLGESLDNSDDDGSRNEQHSHAEIAEHFNLTEQRIRKIIQDAIAKLRELVANNADDYTQFLA